MDRVLLDYHATIQWIQSQVGKHANLQDALFFVWIILVSSLISYVLKSPVVIKFTILRFYSQPINHVY